MPVHGGAMARLAEMLRALDRNRLPIHVTPVVRDMVQAMARVLPLPQRVALRAVLRPAIAGAVLDRIGSRASLLDPILHNTVSPTILRTTDKFNVIPSEIGLVLDGRILPGLEPDDLIRELRDLVGADVEVEVLRHDPGPPEPDMSQFEMLAGILAEADPGSIAVPLLLPGVTDGRFFSRLGIQTYGFLPMKLPEEFDFWHTLHAADERIPVEAVEFGAQAVYRALERFGSAA
jgi:acetylornithine deacetylase/succinyl-diaminopimelate desuccinylase-like protein